MSTIIPVYYAVSQKIMVDDEEDFVQSLLMPLGAKSLRYINNPEDVVVYLNDYNKSIQQDSHELASCCVTSTPEISVLITDYHMPQMTGLEMLEKINAPQIKKIMVTGGSDYRIAIDAFNRGLIHAYIRKEEKDFVQQLAAAIKRLEWQYFSEKSEGKGYQNYNDAVVNVFKKHFENNKIQSFHLIQSEGDYLLIDNKNEKSYFIIRHRKQLELMALAGKEDGANAEVVEQINQGKGMPFFGENVAFWQVPGNEWAAHMKTLTPIDDEWFFVSIKE